MKKVGFILLVLFILVGCSSDHDVVSKNISKEADQFRVDRRIVFYNSITDTYMLEIIGRCGIDLERSNVMEVTCKVDKNEYQKHYLGLSDNVTYTVEQLETSNVSKYRYEIVFKPESIIPIKIGVE